MTDPELRALVNDTLLVWGGGACAAWDGQGLRVAAADGRVATVHRGGPGRWMLHAEGRRPRACASIVALLGALRAAVGPDERPSGLRMVG